MRKTNDKQTARKTVTKLYIFYVMHLYNQIQSQTKHCHSGPGFGVDKVVKTQVFTTNASKLRQQQQFNKHPHHKHPHINATLQNECISSFACSVSSYYKRETKRHNHHKFLRCTTQVIYIPQNPRDKPQNPSPILNNLPRGGLIKLTFCSVFREVVFVTNQLTNQ